MKNHPYLDKPLRTEAEYIKEQRAAFLANAEDIMQRVSLTLKMLALEDDK